MGKKISVWIFLSIFSIGVWGQANFLTESAYEFATNPSQFLFEIENDCTFYMIPTAEKKFNIQTNLIMTTLTVLNLDTRYLIYYDEKNEFKAIVSFSYWNILGLSMIDSGEAGFDASASGFVPALIFSKEIQENVTFYGGLKYSIASLEVKLDEPIADEDDDISSLGFDLTEIDEAKDDIAEPSIFWGISTPISLSKEFNICVGYQLNTQSIFSKVQYSTKFFNFALGMYPDSVVFLHPQVTFQLNF